MGGVLILAHIIAEGHSIVLLFFPSVTNIYVEKWVHVAMPPGSHLNLPWFLYLGGADFLLCSVIFIAALQAYCYNYKSYLEWKPYSNRLYTMWGIYCVYHVIDAMMLYINFKQGILWYWSLLAITIAGCVSLMWPVKK
jgi:hypothetical protein